jgi:hypothetical protein
VSGVRVTGMLTEIRTGLLSANHKRRQGVRTGRFKTYAQNTWNKLNYNKYVIFSSVIITLPQLCKILIARKLTGIMVSNSTRDISRF